MNDSDIDGLEGPKLTLYEVSGHLERIAAQFKPGVKTTLLVRRPNHPDLDFVITDDDLTEAIAGLERRRVKIKEAT